MDCEQAASQLPAPHHTNTHNDCSKTIDEKLAKLTLLKEKLLAANSVEPLVEAVSRALSQSASQVSEGSFIEQLYYKTAALVPIAASGWTLLHEKRIPCTFMPLRAGHC